jgi:hypothetical protein
MCVGILDILYLLGTCAPFPLKDKGVAAPAGAFDPVHCGSIGPNAWHMRYAELHRRILAGEAPQRYVVAHVRCFTIQSKRLDYKLVAAVGLAANHTCVERLAHACVQW